MKSLLCFLLLTLASVTSEVLATTVNEQKHFSLQLPQGFQVAKTSPVEDFEMYTISKGTQPYLYIYVGNQPSFPKTENSHGDEVSELAGPNVSIRSEWKGVQLVGREILFSVSNANGWPTRIHAWTARLLSPQVQVADRILFSIKTK
jgi:hypothetical protein